MELLGFPLGTLAIIYYYLFDHLPSSWLYEGLITPAQPGYGGGPSRLPGHRAVAKEGGQCRGHTKALHTSR